MQEFTQQWVIFDLNNASIYLSEENKYNTILQEKCSKSLSSNTNLQINQPPQYILKFNFDFIQSQPLTPLKPQITLFQLVLGINHSVKVNLLLSKLFDLQTLLYFTQFQSIYINQKSFQKGNFLVKTTQIDSHSYLKHNISISFFTNYQQDISQNSYSTLIIGNQTNKWPFSIDNFKVTLQKLQKNVIFQSSQQKPILKNLNLNNDFSYPLIDSLELQSQQTKVQMFQKITKLKNYASPSPTQLDQKMLYICHDMKGGYIEDISTYTPVRLNKKSHNYRYSYLSQTKIFNYFSHYPITIPPKMWRNICKKYNVLCLGTFIVQNNTLKMEQDSFLTEQFALKLIYIAKKANFDGFLINIQIPIRQPQRLVNWLQFLTDNINKLIPNSQIIWYDSVIKSGHIQYQNQLNNKNKQFYKVSNGIFTNYWWNEESLKTSISHKIKEKSIYIGNDCFGRNTYGGGKYDIFKAVNKIKQIGKHQLSIALFAQGWTYQDNGQNDRHIFNQNQIKMYHGNQVISKNIQKWKYTLNGGQGWKIQDQWAVTSNQLCKRQALVRLNQFQGLNETLRIYFSAMIVGTGPNYSDYYKIALQVYDYKNNVVYLESIYPNTIASQIRQLVQIKMEINCQLVTESICLRILEEGKDAEYWAGNYGTRFKAEKVSFITQSKQKNWIQQIPVRSTLLNHNYTTFFNRGQGYKFYYFGQEKQCFYSSLSDFDIPPVASLNNSLNLQISYEDAYLGGTCLKFQNTKNIILNKFYIQNNQKLQKIYRAIVVIKNTKISQIKCGNKSSKFQKINKDNSKNGWEINISQPININNTGDFTVSLIFQNSSGLIGQFSLISDDLSQISQNLNNSEKHLKNQKQINVQASIKLSFSKKPKYIMPYCVDIYVQSVLFDINLNQKRSQKVLLIKIGDFSGFMHVQIVEVQQQDKKSGKMIGLLKDIPMMIKKVEQFSVEILDMENLSSEYTSKTVLRQNISKANLSKMIHNNELIFQLKL